MAEEAGGMMQEAGVLEYRIQNSESRIQEIACLHSEFWILDADY